MRSGRPRPCPQETPRVVRAAREVLRQPRASCPAARTCTTCCGRCSSRRSPTRYLRGRDLVAHGTGWVERIVFDDPETSTYFTPLAISLNIDSFEHLEFETRPDQLLVYTLVQGDERVVDRVRADRRPPERRATPPRRASSSSTPAVSSRWSCSASTPTRTSSAIRDRPGAGDRGARGVGRAGDARRRRPRRHGAVRARVAPARLGEEGLIGVEGIASYFKFAERGTNLATEVKAGVTTFMVMAYILLREPRASSPPPGSPCRPRPPRPPSSQAS